MWTVLFVAAIDVGLGLAFRYPDNPQVPPTELARYFDYGRSVESKLARMVGSNDADSSPIVAAGWLGRECVWPIPSAPPGQLGVSIYGMSFSQQVGEALPEIDPSLAPVTRNGPGASPNHSYTCFRMLHDAGRDPNPVQILGVLASSLPRMLSLSGITTSFEAPMPFTFPRYRLGRSGELVAEQPLITSPEELRDPDRLKAFRAQLARSDAFYDPWQVDADLADRSVLLRLLRRSYAQREFAIRRKRLIGDDAGFVDNPQLGPVLEALLVDFDTRARDASQIPIVLLIQDRGSKDALYRLLAPALHRARILFVSTHGIVPTTDSANFVADGHFTPTANRRITEQVASLIRSEIAARATHSTTR